MTTSVYAPNNEPRKTIGYARVSTDEQTTALQTDALRAVGVDEIFQENASGGSRKRPQLEAALAALQPGDTLVVWRLDRLGRSLQDLLAIADELRARDIALRSLTEAIDTSTPAGRMLYSVIGAVAQFEREVIRERVCAGIAAKKRRGERVGRRKALSPSRIDAARALLDTGLGYAHVARVLKVGRSTLYRSLPAA